VSDFVLIQSVDAEHSVRLLPSGEQITVPALKS
jgi:hypothetical protein